MLRKVLKLSLLGGGLLAASAGAAAAGTLQTTMPVTALTLNACAVVAAPLAFGSINQINGVATDSQTTVTVSCTPGVAYNVGLDTGANAASGVRQMKSVIGNAHLPYAIYSDAARTSPWGNTVGTDTVAQTAGLLPTLLTVYGRVPSTAGLVGAGAFSDAVTVTVTF